MKYIAYIFIWTGLVFTAEAQDLSQLKNQKAFKTSGSIDIRTIAYQANGITNRRSPFSYFLSGNTTFSLYNIDIPVSFVFSEQDRNFRQPFNQYGLSPTYKWLTIHAGYRNLSYSPYTLAGHTILGAGFELKPSKWSIGFVTGRLNRATAIDTSTGSLVPYSFSRYGSAAKISYGDTKSYLGLSFLTAKDSEKGFKDNLDSSFLRPSSNQVLGLETKVTLFNSFYLQADGAISLLTKDNNTLLEIDSTISIPKPFDKIFKVNPTSEYYLAYSTSFGYQFKDYNIQLVYKYVDPNFSSMGAYYFQNDLKNITINPSASFFKQKMRVSGSFGIQEDNLKKLKEATTKRIISMANLNWDFNQNIGLDANYSNFNTNAQPSVTLIEQKYLLTQTNSNLSISPRLLLNKNNNTQLILLSFNQSLLKDLNPETAHNNEIKSIIAYLNYNYQINELQLGINTGLNYTVNKISIGDVINQGANLGLSKTFLKNKMNTLANASFVLTKMEAGNGQILNIGGSANYTPIKGHRLNFRISSMNTSLPQLNQENKSFSELTGELGYTFSF